MNNNPTNPLQGKLMVLYVDERTTGSRRAISLAEPYPEILIQNIHDIVNRPEWLEGCPTGALISKRVVYRGSTLIQFLEYYHELQQKLSGAQEENVIDNIGYETGDLEYDSKTSRGFPVGESVTGYSVGSFQSQNPEPDNTRYGDGPITEQDLAQHIRRRQQVLRRPQQLVPSNLEDGKFVTM